MDKGLIVKKEGRLNYLRTLSAELHLRANQVRDLIGGTNWAAEGGHKEILLESFLRKYLPTGTLCGKGFILSPNGSMSLASREQDILVVDTTHHKPVFNNDGIIITHPEFVLAVISVKTGFTLPTIRDSIDTLRTARECMGELYGENLFCGAFFFTEPDCLSKALTDTAAEIIGGRYFTDSPRASKIPIGPDVFATPCNTLFQLESGLSDSGVGRNLGSLIPVSPKGLAASLFILLLITHINKIQKKDRSDFSDEILSQITKLEEHEPVELTDSK